MPTIADLLNAPTGMEFEGKPYKLRKPTLLEQGEFQRWLEQLAYDSIARRTYQNEAEKAECFRLHGQDCAAGVYEWGGDVATRRLLTPKGLAKLVNIICRADGLDLEAAERLVDLEQRKIAAALFGRSTDDPKERAAALAMLGLPVDFYASETSSSTSQTRPSDTPSTTSEASATSS